ncbi:thioredoxin family protein [Peribacillus asahii]|uniref:Thioredoxin family protein n=1 Tax=Peribacillus asahii TaxID=228899 RepID=A0A398B364_9BACI|nr:thioredoxin family protein [Peribacillus asahii]RID84305.1 thioredoxin family protein [Peribacillus asahii]
MALNTWFEKGQTFEQYRTSMQVNQAEVTAVYEQVQLNDEDQRFLTDLRQRNWRGIVLTADWCGDAALNVPIIQRMAEVSDIELRFLIRDENLELMNQYLTNGTSRSIPIFIFIDKEGNEVRVWGPRADEIQQLVTSLRNNLPESNSPDFEEKQTNMYREFKQKITTDPNMWRTVIDSVKVKLA